MSSRLLLACISFILSALTYDSKMVEFNCNGHLLYNPFDSDRMELHHWCRGQDNPCKVLPSFHGAFHCAALDVFRTLILIHLLNPFVTIFSISFLRSMLVNGLHFQYFLSGCSLLLSFLGSSIIILTIASDLSF